MSYTEQLPAGFARLGRRTEKRSESENRAKGREGKGFGIGHLVVPHVNALDTLNDYGPDHPSGLGGHRMITFSAVEACKSAHETHSAFAGDRGPSGATDAA